MISSRARTLHRLISRVAPCVINPPTNRSHNLTFEALTSHSVLREGRGGMRWQTFRDGFPAIITQDYRRSRSFITSPPVPCPDWPGLALHRPYLIGRKFADFCLLADTTCLPVKLSNAGYLPRFHLPYYYHYYYFLHTYTYLGLRDLRCKA
jgi:hypothetical protein